MTVPRPASEHAREWRSDPAVRAKLTTLTEEWLDANPGRDEEALGEVVYTLFEEREARRRALAVVEQERDEALAALKDEMKWDMGGVPENEWKRRAESAEQERDQLRELLGDSIPALAQHARDFSQRTLIEACKITGSDPYEWSAHPDVLDRLTVLDAPSSEPAGEPEA